MTYPLGVQKSSRITTLRRVGWADLSKAGVGNHAFGAEVELFHDHVFRGDRKALDAAGTALRAKSTAARRVPD